MFKKVKVVMLSTNEKSKLVLSFKEVSFNQLIKPKLTLIEEANYQLSNIQSQHLYFLSDEEIKEGDWFINNDGVWQHNGQVHPQKSAKKIIATTDKYLIWSDGSKGGIYPWPSNSFVEKYVEEYNKGNVIEWVNVEYDEAWNCDGDYVCALKISKDNTITIKKVKDSWTREEVIELFAKLSYEMAQRIIGNRGDIDTIVPHEWIEENL